MMTVEDITRPIVSELDDFEQVLRKNLQSNAPLLDKITHYIVKRKGKQVRPMFLLLVAKMLGEINDKTHEAASLVEILHTATLVHDDVVDDANERRGFYSINALWKNKIAVLVGDYFLSKILLLSIEKDNVDILRVVAKAVQEMSEGELLQIEKARKLDITEEVYFEVIRQKTASLISCVCEAAAVSVGREEERERMRKFGELIGIAFQIKDDIFDYGTPNDIGKPTGLDIREQKMTLPLIYVLNKAPKEVKKELRYIVKNQNENSQKVKRAVSLVVEHGGIAYAHQRMMEYKEEALSLIEHFPESPAKESLIGLVEYTVERKK
ncbi:MAG: polyprenyl synthetase family protein [Crocinitomicaceae bacterium]|jgi:octaprenyl-diphosphate synthase|nr:polyprenyl synthetase family protein [Crocinitomicaceae bacterium]